MTYFQFTSQSQHNTPLEYGVQRTEQLECRGKRHNCSSRMLTKAVNNNDSQIYNITPTVYIFFTLCISCYRSGNSYFFLKLLLDIPYLLFGHFQWVWNNNELSVKGSRTHWVLSRLSSMKAIAFFGTFRMWISNLILRKFYLHSWI